MSIIKETKFTMHKYNIHPNKNLGQNFLIDDEALNTIAEHVEKDDTIIEIGPGLGTLTAILLEKTKKVIVIELDNKMIEILEDRFKLYNNIEIINQDILKVDINRIAKKAKIVANLPYYITTQIITKIIKSDVEDITVLIQKEVAERICAIPGTKHAGAITYYIYYYADAKIIKNVPKESFISNPKVESAIVRINKLDKPRVKVLDEDLFFKIIKENFTKRRKNLLNSISNIIEREKLIDILKQLGIDERQRGEELSLEQFAKISNLYTKLK